MGWSWLQKGVEWENSRIKTNKGLQDNLPFEEWSWSKKGVEFFTLPSEDWELDETTNNIEDVVEIVGSPYGQKRHGEALSLLTQLIVTLNNHFERDGWYSMFDDFNRMDDSGTRDDMMDLFEKLLQDKTLPLSLIGSVLQILKMISEENVLVNYTSWDISPLLSLQDKAQDNNIHLSII